MYITCIFCVYTNNTPKFNTEILHAGQGRGILFAPQTVSSKRLDDIDWLQRSDILPKGLAASVVLVTVLGAHHSSHGFATTRSHLALYTASHRYCCGPLQPFRRGHSARPDFLQALWGTSIQDCWNHGIERNPQGIRALTCSYSLRQEGWGPPQLSSTHSMLSGRKCNLKYSKYVQQPTEGRFWVLLCQCSWPYLEEGQPCLRDQLLVVELGVWTPPASRGRPLCDRNWKAPTEVHVWGFQARMGSYAG